MILVIFGFLEQDTDHRIQLLLWYLAQVATELNLSLDEIAEYNIEKLIDRLERGKIQGDGDNR